MKGIYVKRNIYDRNGVLLLAAGQIITDDTLKRLEALDYIDIKDVIATEYPARKSSIKSVEYRSKDFKQDIQNSVDKLKLILKIKNVHIFDSRV